LAFSSHAPAGQQMQSPPLKAVYRDCVVGIRYLHPWDVAASSAASFRRFQVNFADEEAASQFINAIQPVCPCQSQGGQGRATLTRTATTTAQSSSLVDPGTQSRPISIPMKSKPLSKRTGTVMAIQGQKSQPRSSAQDHESSNTELHASSDSQLPSSFNFCSSSRPASSAFRLVPTLFAPSFKCAGCWLCIPVIISGSSRTFFELNSEF